MATIRPRGLCGLRYPKQRPYCSVGLKQRVAGRGRRSRGGHLHALYASSFATRSHSTHYKNKNRKNESDIYKSTISREQTKAQHLSNRIYFKYCMQCCQSRKQNQTVLFFQ